ncbi:MAG: four helix bundle protein [bacterium]|nr:four helix bundle protein [bacterium]
MNQDIILEKGKEYAHLVYKISAKFPKEEQFGLTSQLRRAAVSVPLNVVEGYARQSRKSESQFLTIAYGSLKESQFILQFAVDEKYIAPEDIIETLSVGEEVAKLIWAKTKTLRAHE